MRDWVAGGLMTIGALIALATAIRATTAFLLYLRLRKAEPDDRRARAIAGLELAYSNSLNGALCGGGLLILVGGAVVGSLMQRSVLLAPAGLIAGALLNALFISRTLDRVRNSSL